MHVGRQPFIGLLRTRKGSWHRVCGRRRPWAASLRRWRDCVRDRDRDPLLRAGRGVGLHHVATVVVRPPAPSAQPGLPDGPPRGWCLHGALRPVGGAHARAPRPARRPLTRRRVADRAGVGGLLARGDRAPAAPAEAATDSRATAERRVAGRQLRAGDGGCVGRRLDTAGALSDSRAAARGAPSVRGELRPAHGAHAGRAVAECSPRRLGARACRGYPARVSLSSAWTEARALIWAKRGRLLVGLLLLLLNRASGL